MRSLLRDLGYAEMGAGIVALIVAIFLIALPSQIPWLAPFWLRTLGVAIIFLLILRGAYKAWDTADKEQDKLQVEKDSRESNVELTDFDRELQYKKMKNSRGDVIVIRLAGRLRNNSSENCGSLDFFRVEVDTPYGSFIAKSDNPPLGHTFIPNSIYPNKIYTFTGELVAPHIGSWELFIKGAEGRINLAVQGQTIKTYPIKIADTEGFYEL